MPGRIYTATNQYRYGFNGKEQDSAINGNGVDYDYGFRVYDARIGKFLTEDPLAREYPFYTPYQFGSNTPIFAIDIDGLESSKLLNVVDNNQSNKAAVAATYGRTPAERFNPGLYFKHTQKEAIQGTRQVGKAVLVAAAVTADVLLTKGWASTIILSSIGASAFHDNKAKTPEGRAEQDEDSKAHATAFIFWWGGGELFGKIPIGGKILNGEQKNILNEPTVLTSVEKKILADAKSILNSKEFEILKSAYKNGTSAEVNVGGRIILYDPNFTYGDAMTLHNEGGFLLGPTAFVSEQSVKQTVLWELTRLHTQNVGGLSVTQTATFTQSAEQTSEKLLPFIK